MLVEVQFLGILLQLGLVIFQTGQVMEAKITLAVAVAEQEDPDQITINRRDKKMLVEKAVRAASVY
jgi:hypothetical protein